MDWTNERYVRLYTRDTLTWKRLRFEGQTVLMHTMRKLDRSGVLDLNGMNPAEAVELVTDVPHDIIAEGLPRCIELGCFILDDDRILMPNFLEAQEAKASNAERQRRYRAAQKTTHRNAALRDDGSSETNGNAASLNIDKRNPVPSVPSTLCCTGNVTRDDPFDIGHLDGVYSDESKAAGRGPYKRKMSEYQKAEDALDELKQLAEQVGKPVAEVSRESARRYLTACSDSGLIEKSLPYWGWANHPSRWYLEAHPMDTESDTSPQNDATRWLEERKEKKSAEAQT